MSNGIEAASESELAGRIGRSTPLTDHSDEDMMACVCALPPMQRAVIVLRFVDDLPIACDVQQKEHDSCGGWDDFSNEQLSTFFTELTGRSLIVA